MLLQLDGSHHVWLEDRGPWLTLLLAVDDATGTAPYALFQEQEDTRGYLSLLQGIIERRGVPMAVYTDGHAVFPATASSIGPIPGSRERTINPMEPGPGRTGDHPDIGPQSRGQRKGGASQRHLPGQAGGGTSSGWRLHPGGGESSAGQVSASVQPALRGACGPGGVGLPASETRSWTWVACCASRSCAEWPKTTRCNTTGGLCNSFPVWSAPAMPGPE